MAEDCVHAAFLELWRHRARYTGSHSTASRLLFRAVRNAALNEAAKGRPDGDAALKGLPDAAFLVSDFLDAECLKMDFTKAFLGLSRSLRVVFWHRRIRGATIAETAEALLLSTQTVKNRYTQATTQLAITLGLRQ